MADDYLPDDKDELITWGQNFAISPQA